MYQATFGYFSRRMVLGDTSERVVIDLHIYLYIYLDTFMPISNRASFFFSLPSLPFVFLLF